MRMGPVRFSAQATWSGKTEASRSSERMRWMGGGHLACRRGSAEWRARGVAFQRQRAVNMGASSRAWRQHVFHGVGLSGIRRRVSSGKACCSLSERTMPLSVAAACSSKLKVRQKRLRSASPQARLMREPKGACRTSCMPPDSSKKRSATTRVRGGQRAQCRRAGPNIGDGLAGAGFVEAAIAGEPRRVWIVGSIARGLGRPRPTARRERPGASPSQNGNGGRGAVGILDAHAARLDVPDAPGVGAEQEDVAGQAFDGEVLVERADGFAFGLGDHGVGGVLGNRAAGGDGGEARAAAAADAAVHLIAMQQGAAAAARGGDAFGEHLDDGVEIVARRDCG